MTTTSYEAKDPVIADASIVAGYARENKGSEIGRYWFGALCTEHANLRGLPFDVLVANYVFIEKVTIDNQTPHGGNADAWFSTSSNVKLQFFLGITGVCE
ncbi:MULTISPECIES: hypothetical protein [unclassified Ruegeria]|uniref:hypothetical protein n=1 Tax=unclassified Ruegeria TaxID=2625375 RepID=UPI001ADBF8F7|nr:MULTISPECIES: hypothetical protein [unclassified Ruegeria]MBO9410984.1 hypothetical protein [Ruegeria sp. R8_1]MBO9415185.1 hypothetical protein [Ruegeria sp. R8_2]